MCSILISIQLWAYEEPCIKYVYKQNVNNRYKSIIIFRLNMNRSVLEYLNYYV